LLALSGSLSFAAPAKPADHFVGPDGTRSGQGTMSSPWDLQTALNQPSSVRPGDTIWVLGGTYRSAISDGFTSHLNGTAAQPIIVRNYNDERATIDGQKDYAALSVDGSYAWYWGLEVMSSCTARKTAQTTCSLGVGTYGPGNKFINLVVHDTTQGFSGFNAAPDNEFYGNLSYYNGFVGPDRNHGHGMYLQNISGTKTVSDNLVFDNADEGIQIYGSGNASLINFVVTGNTLFDNDSWPTPNYQYNLIIAGGKSRKNIAVANNYSYFPPDANAEGFGGQFGEYSAGEDMSVTNNVFANGYAPVAFTGQAGPVSFTGNIVVAAKDALRCITVDLWPGESLASYTWDRNTYYDQSLGHFFQGSAPEEGSRSFSGTNVPFAGWQAQTKFDADSTYKPSAPTGVWIYVRPNKYEARRANVTIFNWDQRPTVLVDLSKVLSLGDSYVIQDAQNFYGPAVTSGVYAGKPVAVRMSGLEKAIPVGFVAPRHTAPRFGTFIVLPIAARSRRAEAGTAGSTLPGASK
jgi:parallel beta-helix repeat protein